MSFKVMKMKKYLALFLALVLCLSVTAYAEDLDGNSGNADAPAYEDLSLIHI